MIYKKNRKNRNIKTTDTNWKLKLFGIMHSAETCGRSSIFATNFCLIKCYRLHVQTKIYNNVGHSHKSVCKTNIQIWIFQLVQVWVCTSNHLRKGITLQMDHFRACAITDCSKHIQFFLFFGTKWTHHQNESSFKPRICLNISAVFCFVF